MKVHFILQNGHTGFTLSAGTFWSTPQWEAAKKQYSHSCDDALASTAFSNTTYLRQIHIAILLPTKAKTTKLGYYKAKWNLPMISNSLFSKQKMITQRELFERVVRDGMQIESEQISITGLPPLFATLGQQQLFENRLDTVEGLFSVNLCTFHRRLFQMNKCLVDPVLVQATSLALRNQRISR